jgi:hypothetical protein
MEAIQTSMLLPGHDTLLSGTAAADNTAMRFDVLDSNTTGPDNPLASWIWRVRGELHTPRESHTATLLQNGKVLVAGGSGITGVLTSTELGRGHH